jgi:hypothetical protein
MWVYPRDEEPTNENLIPFSSDHYVQWGIIFQPRNEFRTRHGDVEVNSIGGVTITRNGVEFYTVCGGIEYGIAEARHLIHKIQEHPLDLNFIDFDKNMIGRKVWWRSQPGIITKYIHRQACVIIEPDEIDRFEIPAEFNNDSDCMIFNDDEKDIKADIFDAHIWWFRE